MDIRRVLHWLASFIIIAALWPILKWFIFVLIIIFVIAYFKAKKEGNVFTVNLNDLHRPRQKEIHNPDIIDVEVKERKVKDGTL